MWRPQDDASVVVLAVLKIARECLGAKLKYSDTRA